MKLRKPVCVNDLATQALLWDRRCVLAVLDHLNIPTPERLIASRDGGPKVVAELARQVEANIGLVLGKSVPTSEVTMREDGDAIIVDGVEMEKPFVEKPVSGEDHNVYIYFKGGEGRRLFRKVRASFWAVYYSLAYYPPLGRSGTSLASWILTLRILGRMDRTYTKSSSTSTIVSCHRLGPGQFLH